MMTIVKQDLCSSYENKLYHYMYSDLRQSNQLLDVRTSLCVCALGRRGRRYACLTYVVVC